MSDQVFIAVIGAVSSAVNLFLFWLLRRDVQEVHKATNSIVTQLVATTKLEAHQAGVNEERGRANPPTQP